MSDSVEQHVSVNRVNAAMIATGIGAISLGFFVILTEMSKSAKDFLTLNAGVGALSGKTTGAVAVWLLAWLVLDRSMRKSKLAFEKAFNLMLLLVAGGLLGTFPIFFKMFGG